MAYSCISVKGARTHNLKNIDVEIPHHALTVITGLSGSGKSTLAFDTLYAEGQRRYVETFSPYTRQFLDRMDKPDVDHIEGIPPAIAIEQSNSVKSSRSTVGTMTEIADYLKMLAVRVAELTCPKCGRTIRPWSATEASTDLLQNRPGLDVLVTFRVALPKKFDWTEINTSLQAQGYQRILVNGEILRLAETENLKLKTENFLTVIQDRLKLAEDNRARLTEAIDGAYLFGKGVVRLVPVDKSESNSKLNTKNLKLTYTNRWFCPEDDLEFKEPTPSLFSFNNPVGACPTCRGFGRTIEIDYELALPDRTLSIAEGVVKPWQSGVSAECQKDLLKACKKHRIPTDVPFRELSKEHQRFVIEGKLTDAKSLNELWEAGEWYGVKGFFEWLETKTYKMHVRVFLSRYRAYKVCPVCHGARFQPETLQFHLPSAPNLNPKTENLKLGLSVADINQLSLGEAVTFFQSLPISVHDEAAEQLRAEIVTRLTYLVEVGLGYLTLDRATRTLSGGEIERVNLTSCLGNSLVNTLFVLDEPSIGLHPRDTDQLLRVIHRLRDRGNTVVVVEHEEAVMKAADHILDLGPGRGAQGGNVVFAGNYPDLLKSKTSLTGDYLSGRKKIDRPDPAALRRARHHLMLEGIRSHNIDNLDLTLPLGVFCAITGVSGSGKSSLVHEVIYKNLLALQGKRTEPGGTIKKIKGAQHVGEVVRVDQSPLTKTPRSNALLYLGAYDAVRDLFAATEAALAQGLTAGAFSFNSGLGRCQRCSGTGYEKVEMQFLSDVYVTCAVCEGKRFQNHLLQIQYRGKSIHDVLNMTVEEAMQFFGAPQEDATPIETKRRANVCTAIQLLTDVGLHYLTLGQPLNQLSGGEAQRIKLISYLSGVGSTEDEESGDSESNPQSAVRNPQSSRLFILDEPTTGLHFDDIRLLLAVFQRMVGEGHSLFVIEHNLDVIQCADWVIDLGPEAGAGGGKLVAEGTPEEIASHSTSHTGRFLKEKWHPTQSSALREAPLHSAFRTPHSEMISIRGANHHNLKNLNVDIELGKTTVLTGLSGSGKSTLGFDILFAEGQRRYLDSLNAYARQFIEQLEKPDVDSITGIPPSVAIEQRLTRGGSKSTIATVTEVYQFIRLLYAKLGEAHDPETGEAAVRQSPAEILERIELARGKQELVVLAPLIRARKGFHTEIAKWAEKKGYPELRVDGKWIEPAKFKALDRFKEHSIDVVLGTLSQKQTPVERRKLVETALDLGRGTMATINPKSKEVLYSTQLYCPTSGRSFDELDPRLFSFNSVHGWCPQCQGYGTFWTKSEAYAARLEDHGYSETGKELALDRGRDWAEDDEIVECPSCHGARLNDVGRSVTLPLGKFRIADSGLRTGGKKTPKRISPSAFPIPHSSGPTIPDLTRLTIRQAHAYFETIKVSGRSAAIARDILPEITQRLAFLEQVGLGYLTLDRSAPTLSGGESQRIRLAAQLGSNLQGVLYVLDEPTIGLHPRDNRQLLDSLDTLKAKGNTLVIIEHDDDTMKRADRIIDLGPGAGVRGGQIIADGTWKELLAHGDSVTGRAMSDQGVKIVRRPVDAKTPRLILEHVKANNLKDLTVSIPTGRLVVFCGVSGAGKSTLMHEVIFPLVSERAKNPKFRKQSATRNPKSEIRNYPGFTAVYEVDQSPIGKTSRSTPATYIGLMDELRGLFAQLPLAKQRGYGPGRFSFNSSGGRCEACQGAGVIKVEMNFLPTTDVHCETCGGKRFNRETLEILYNGKTIADVLALSIDEAVEFFDAVPRLKRPLELLQGTGLGYLTLGQRSPTLSGGEAQRIKLVAELSRSLEMNEMKRLRTRGFEKLHNLYLLEEPTIGLHLQDVRKLLEVLQKLVNAGHTVIVIEHHLDVIAAADWVLELGPEGGEKGGHLIAEGPPEKIAKSKKSPTAPFLAERLSN